MPSFSVITRPIIYFWRPTYTGVKLNCYKSFFVLSVYSRTFEACWTTHCVKGLLSFNPLALTHVLPDVTTSKLCEVSMFGKSGIVFTKFVTYFCKEISDFQLCCELFSHGNVSLFWEFWIGQPTKVKHFRHPTSDSMEGCCMYRSREWW